MRHVRLGFVLAALGLGLAALPAAAVVNNTTIYAIQQNVWAPNDTVQVDSVVVIGVDARPSTYGVYIEERAGGAYSGTLAYTSGTFPAYVGGGTPVVGDLIRVKGIYADFSGLAEINNPVLTKLGTTTPIAPKKLPVDSLKTGYAGSERWEGVLVRVDSVKVTNIGTFNEWYFKMTTGPSRNDSTLAGYEKMVSGQIRPDVGDIVNVVGVHDWVASTRRIAPRGDADITFLTPGPAAVPIQAWSTAENKIKIKFNIALNATDATTVSKYSLSTFQAVTLASYDNANKMVTLTIGTNLVPSTTPLVVSMTGIRNYQGTPMVGTQTISLIGGIATIQFVQTPKSASNDTSQVVGQTVSIRGVVTEKTGGTSPDFPASMGGFYLQQRGATQYGAVFVYGSPISPVRGDSVFVAGVVAEFGVGPETEITPIREATIIASGRPAIQPVAVTLHNACGAVPAEAEKYESMLIKISNVINLWQGGPGDAFDISTSLAGTDTMRVDDYAVDEAGYTPWRGDNLDVTGIVRFSGTIPFRRLQPRNWSEPPTGDIHVISKAQVSGTTPPAWRTALEQNSPNPFNPRTEIRFTMAQPGHAAVRIYSVNGALVRTVLDGKVAAGPNKVLWDGTDGAGRQVSTGLYFYRLVTDEVTQTRKMLLVK